MHSFISYECLARLRGGKKKKREKKKKISRQDTLRLRSARFGARLENVKVVFSLYRFVRGHRTDYGGSKAKLAIAVKIKTRKGRRIFRVLGCLEKNKEAGTRIESRKIVIHEVPLDNIVARCFVCDIGDIFVCKRVFRVYESKKLCSEFKQFRNPVNRKKRQQRDFSLECFGSSKRMIS